MSGDSFDYDTRRYNGQQIYIDGTDMQVGDLVEVEPPAGLPFDRAKRWIYVQGWIEALRDVRVVIRTADREANDFHPADLTLISRKED